MKCPHCKKPTADTGRKCVHCNKTVHKEYVRNSHMAIECPHCHVSADLIDLGGVELDFCHKCNGIWFDRGELQQFQNIVQDRNLCEQMIATLKGLPKGNPVSKRSVYLQCPICSQPMKHKNFAEISGVILDRCEEHGTWSGQNDLIEILDLMNGDELENLARKLSEQKKRDMDSKLSKMEQKLTTLDTQVQENRAFSRAHFILDIFFL